MVSRRGYYVCYQIYSSFYESFYNFLIFCDNWKLSLNTHNINSSTYRDQKKLGTVVQLGYLNGIRCKQMHFWQHGKEKWQQTERQQTKKPL